MSPVQNIRPTSIFVHGLGWQGSHWVLVIPSRSEDNIQPRLQKGLNLRCSFNFATRALSCSNFCLSFANCSRLDSRICSRKITKGATGESQDPAVACSARCNVRRSIQRSTRYGEGRGGTCAQLQEARVYRKAFCATSTVGVAQAKAPPRITEKIQ